MQGTVHSFDPGTDAGKVLLDTGRLLPFDAEAFAGSGLRHLRLGQRLSLELTGDPEAEGTVVARLWIAGVGDGRPIP